jgi:hypothetical protein
MIQQVSRAPYKPMRCRSLLIVCVVSLLFCMWYYLHQMVSVAEFSSKPLTHIGDSSTHIQTLIDQTNALLNDISVANSTIALKLRNEMALIQEEKQLIKSDLKQLKQEMYVSEIGFERCLEEKYELHTKLRECRETEKMGSNWSVPVILSESVSTSALAHTDSSANSLKWLVIGIPTVGRRNGEDYLLKYRFLILQYHCVLDCFNSPVNCIL